MPENLLCHLTYSEDETFLVGKHLGDLVSASTVIGLTGTLGSGKTKLTQGIVAGVMPGDQTVVSPTFTICIPYQGRVGLWHLDAYRIQDDEEVFELGLDEAVEDGHVLVIEWVEKIRDLIPALDLEVEIEHEAEAQRKLTFRAESERGIALLQQLRPSLEIGSTEA